MKYLQVSKLGQQEDDREGEGELSPAPSPGPVMSRSVSATPGGQSSSRGRVRRSLSLRHQERQERAGQQSPASPVVASSSSRTVSR